MSDSQEMSGGSALSPHPVGGRRHRKSHKKLRLVKKKTVRRMLAKHGLKMRGGGEDAPPMAGGRRRSKRRTHRRKGMFHF